VACGMQWAEKVGGEERRGSACVRSSVQCSVQVQAEEHVQGVCEAEVCVQRKEEVEAIWWGGEGGVCVWHGEGGVGQGGSVTQV